MKHCPECGFGLVAVVPGDPVDFCPNCDSYARYVPLKRGGFSGEFYLIVNDEQQVFSAIDYEWHGTQGAEFYGFLDPDHAKRRLEQEKLDAKVIKCVWHGVIVEEPAT